MTASTLADRYAILKSDIDMLTEELNRVKAEIKATGMETIVGESAVVVVALSERSTLDTKAAKEFLTKEQIEACTKVTLVETLRVKPKVATLIGA